jgi:hypothetical protein
MLILQQSYHTSVSINFSPSMELQVVAQFYRGTFHLTTMKKLEWFKFSPSEWMMGKISRCRPDTRASYVTLCCLYWNANGQMNPEDAKLEFTINGWQEIIRYKLVEFSDDNSRILIKFLDEQLDDIRKTFERNSLAGKRSAEIRSKRTFNTPSTPLQQPFNTQSTDIRYKNKESIYRQIEHLSITHTEFDKLASIYGKPAVDSIFDDIANYKNIKKYKSLFLTAKKWLELSAAKTNNDLFQSDSSYENIMKKLGK